MSTPSLHRPLTNVFYLLLFITAASVPFRAQADEKSGLTLHPHAGIATSGNIKNFGQDTSFGLGVGYQFNEKWAIEFVKQRASSTLKTPGKPDIDIDNWHVDALYHFAGNDFLVAYASAGYGAIDYDVDGAANDDGNTYNLGLGLKHALSKFTDLRADLRTFRSTDSMYAGTVTTLGFQHRFGSTTKSPTPTKRADDDQDGVPNTADQCPSTPSNAQVDANGCAPDIDQDGVPEHADDCPTTTNRRARVDRSGCYIMVSEDVTITQVFYFATNSYASRESHNPKLNNLVKFLRENSAPDVVITGHADLRGDAEYNLALSENRAETIAEKLLQQIKLDASRVILRSFGETRPEQTNSDAESHSANRRVTVEVFAQKKSIAVK